MAETIIVVTTDERTKWCTVTVAKIRVNRDINVQR